MSAKTESGPRGSSVSSKQIAWAAINGCAVKFHTTVGEIVGYVIGQDDYHWKVAVPSADGSSFQATLVHKGHAPLVTTLDRKLADEPEGAQTSIGNAGRAFWESARSTYSL